MKITVTTTSTSLKDLLVTAYGASVVDSIESARLKYDQSANFGVLMKNGPTNTVYFTNVSTSASSTDGYPIVPTEAVSFDVRELSQVKLVSTTSQPVYVEIF